MKKRAKYASIAALVPLLLFATVGYMHQRESALDKPGADALLLLLPDDVDAASPAAEEWVDAASEEGFHLVPMHDSEFLNPLSTIHPAGVIVPDQIHRTANDVLIGELHRYVEQGGHLMVVYDACTWDLKGRFPPGAARLSNLVGVRYALYDQYGTETMGPAQVTGTSAAMRELGIPPGSFAPIDESGKLSRWQPVALADPREERSAFATYLYGTVDYPVFRTMGDFDGTVLLRSKNGLGAGYRREGQGQVLFVNLPLGYLASRTDGLLLHSFVHFFAFRMIGLPYLDSVPDGVGGLIFNWHVDARSSLRPLKILADQGVFDRGKFSVHLTAGPDVDVFGDQKGLDVLHNPEAQKWVRYLRAHGQEIGSHGGWIHNYFGYHVNDSDQAEFEKYLQMNKDALEQVSGAPVTEYSAPIGNHPAWVTHWLEQHGVVAYYFTGDAGLGPTRVYRNGERDSAKLWAFPILHMGKEASLEEMGFDNVPIGAVRDWMLAVTDYTVRWHTARLVYTHPYGAEKFFPTLRAWLDNAAALEHAGRFRWYTMTDLARFLSERQRVRWSMERAPGGGVTLLASDAKSLAHKTWVFPAGSYSAKARVLEGHAAIAVEDGMILVRATEGRKLEVELDPSVASGGAPAHAMETKR
jgi:hypothetical protein